MSYTILVVEDQEDARRILRDLLTSNGYNVIEATTGLEGVDAATSLCPDLIIMDIQLPGIDGYEATKQIRAVPCLHETPVIAVTAHALNGNEKKAFTSGCDAYIAKPVNLRELLETISQHLRQQSP